MSTRETLTDIVRTYLAAAEARDLVTASALLAPDVEIVFPGGVHHADLQAVVAAASERYRWVSKTIETTDVDADAGTVVVTGQLTGENLHGICFQRVRYVDRFRIADGRIVVQHVWNDLEESRVLEARSDADVPVGLRRAC
jgi:ketosteroid isomerase-like protein